MSLAFPAIATQIVQKRLIPGVVPAHLRAPGSLRINDRRPARSTGWVRIPSSTAIGTDAH